MKRQHILAITFGLVVSTTSVSCSHFGSLEYTVHPPVKRGVGPVISHGRPHDEAAARRRQSQHRDGEFRSPIRGGSRPAREGQRRPLTHMMMS